VKAGEGILNRQFSAVSILRVIEHALAIVFTTSRLERSYELPKETFLVRILLIEYYLFSFEFWRLMEYNYFRLGVRTLPC